MLRVVVVMSLVVGCYSDTDYSATSFKCDATHDCPPGQICVSGRCTAGGGNGDAAVATGVACQGMTCTAGQICCVDFISSTTQCIAASATCNGPSAACDGSEDCGSGNACCDNGSGDVACGPATCAGQQICLDNSDCKKPAQAECCFGIGANEPWGRCFSNCP